MGFVREHGLFVHFNSFTPKHFMNIGDMIDQWASMEMQL